jgi:putative DNA methylase
VHKRKLIEVALPLEAINRESAREKSIRHGHPSTLHLWWARRPLAAARAVLFAQLVDDPSARPEEFPTEELQRAERARLHDLIERLVVWENIRDEKLLAEAHAEIVRSTDGDVPPVLDPFAGGGTIPFEAQRLGLKSNASDLNPVAVLINKALIEIPPRFRGTPPVFPKLAGSQIRSWEGVEGLVADVRAYGDWMRDEAEKRIGHLYPKATLSGGVAANVIAWIWARTVPCPNPACGIEMPLVRSWWVSKKRGKEAYLSPELVADSGHSSGQRVSFKVHDGAGGGPGKADDGTVGRTGARCVACGTSVPLAYVREAGRNRKMGTTMLALVAEANRQRIFLPATQEHVEAAGIPAPDEAIAGSLGFYPRDLKAVTYGLTDSARDVQ